MLNEETMSLANLKEGAVIEAVDVEIQRVLDNIVDPNSDPKTKRTVTLTLSFTPNLERTKMNITAQAKSNLAPDIAIDTMALVGVEGGHGVANEVVPRQMELPIDENVTHINKRKEGVQ
jgi:hypothetical protein